MHTFNNESADFRQEIESDLVYLATVGLEDPVIPGIKSTVQLIRYGRVLTEYDYLDYMNEEVNVRMITGDHKATAAAVAIEAGIVTEAEANTPGVVMTGDEFIKELGQYSKKWDPTEKEWKVQFND